MVTAQRSRQRNVRLFYQHNGSIFYVSRPINDTPASFANGCAIAFKCDSPQQIDEFNDSAVTDVGILIEDAAGLREGALGLMHLAYVRNPDGNKVRAIHRLR